MARDTFIGVDVGGTHTRIGATDGGLNLLRFEKHATQEALAGDPVPRLTELIRGFIGRHGLNPSAVAVGFPSTIDKARERLLSTPNIPGLDGVSVRPLLRAALGIPVMIERDVSMLFFFDAMDHALPLEGIAVGCYFGTGLGNVIRIDGKLLTGKHGVACELGHIPVLGREELCACGNPGCAEHFAAGKALAALRQRRFPDTPMERLFVDHADAPELDGFIEAMSVPVATEINILDPDVVILGGGILAMEGFPRALLEEKIRRHARKPLPAEDLSLLYARPGDGNGVIGAANYAKTMMEVCTV